jgi:hypothetical protein
LAGGSGRFPLGVANQQSLFAGTKAACAETAKGTAGMKKADLVAAPRRRRGEEIAAPHFG